MITNFPIHKIPSIYLFFCKAAITFRALVIQHQSRLFGPTHPLLTRCKPIICHICLNAHERSFELPQPHENIPMGCISASSTLDPQW